MKKGRFVNNVFTEEVIEEEDGESSGGEEGRRTLRIGEGGVVI